MLRYINSSNFAPKKVPIITNHFGIESVCIIFKIYFDKEFYHL